MSEVQQRVLTAHSLTLFSDLPSAPSVITEVAQCSDAYFKQQGIRGEIMKAGQRWARSDGKE